MSLQLEFPLSTSKLKEWVPHRPPMVWVDEVLSVESTSAKCRVLMEETRPFYESPSKIRPSVLVEWMAQAFAYSAICRQLMNVGTPTPIRRAFLVGIAGAKFDMTAWDAKGKSVFVSVETVRELAPLVLFRGTVTNEDGRTLSTASLKVYVERR